MLIFSCETNLWCFIIFRKIVLPLDRIPNVVYAVKAILFRSYMLCGDWAWLFPSAPVVTWSRTVRRAWCQKAITGTSLLCWQPCVPARAVTCTQLLHSFCSIAGGECQILQLWGKPVKCTGISWRHDIDSWSFTKIISSGHFAAVLIVSLRLSCTHFRFLRLQIEPLHYNDETNFNARKRCLIVVHYSMSIPIYGFSCWRKANSLQ